MGELKPGKPRSRPKAEPVSLELVEYPGLTARQNAFVFWFARLLIGGLAAERAGYSKRSSKELAHKLRGIPSVANAIRQELQRHADAMAITEPLILLRLNNLAEQCAEPGETFNPSAAIRANELIGKSLKMFTDVVDHTVGLRLTHEEALAELDDQELDDDGRAGAKDPGPAEG